MAIDDRINCLSSTAKVTLGPLVYCLGLPDKALIACTPVDLGDFSR